MQNYFLELSEKINKAEQREIQSIQIIKEGKNYQYYCKVVEYLNF